MGSKMLRRALAMAGVALIISTTAAFASSADVSVVDTTAPNGSVTISPGGSGNITINLSVTGSQAGTATFEVYRDWTLSGGVFTGSNPQEFSVPPRATGSVPATTFSTTGTVSVDALQSNGTFTLAVAVFDITNTNATGAKLGAGAPSNYQVTVPGDPCVGVLAPAAPAISPDPTTAFDGQNGWFVTIPSVSASTSTVGATMSYATEANGGAKSVYSSTAPTLGNGTTIVYARATSATCSKTSESSATFSVDTLAPDIADGGFVSGASGSNGWYKSAVTNAFSASDNANGSGLGGFPTPWTVSSGTSQGSSVQISSGPVTDVAGNTNSGINSAGYMIDLDIPSILDDGYYSGTAGSNGWYVSSVENQFSASDAVSGLGAFVSPFRVSSGTAEGSSVVINSGSVTDVAGHSNPGIASGSYKIDLSNPYNVAFTGGALTDGANYYFGSVPAGPTGCTASDDVSTVASCAVSGYGTGIGSHTVTATATDYAGRTGTATIGYTVLAWTLNGFYQPVDMGNVWNTVKGGSTVPFKFEVFAGSTEKTDPADITAFSAVAATCPSGYVTTDAIEVVATGGTVLRYDATAGQFVYNWQTPKKPGSCYIVTMTTDDGSTLAAKFILK